MYFSHTNFCVGARNVFWWWNIRTVEHFAVEEQVSAQQWSSRPRVKYMQGSCNKHKDINTSMKCSRSGVLQRLCDLRAPIIGFVRRWTLIQNERYFVGCWMTLDRFLNVTCLLAVGTVCMITARVNELMLDIVSVVHLFVSEFLGVW